MSRRHERSHLELAASHRVKVVLDQILVGVIGGLAVGVILFALREFFDGRTVRGIGFVLVTVVLVVIALIGVLDAGTHRALIRQEERLAGLHPYEGARFRAVWLVVGDYRRFAVYDAETDEVTQYDDPPKNVLARVAAHRDLYVWVPASWFVVAEAEGVVS